MKEIRKNKRNSKYRYQKEKNEWLDLKYFIYLSQKEYNEIEKKVMEKRNII